MHFGGSLVLVGLSSGLLGLVDVGGLFGLGVVRGGGSVMGGGGVVVVVLGSGMVLCDRGGVRVLGGSSNGHGGDQRHNHGSQDHLKLRLLHYRVMYVRGR